MLNAIDTMEEKEATEMKKIIEVTRKLYENYPKVHSDVGKTLPHGAWMMDNLPHESDKKNRWIGYAQCLLVMNAVVTLDELRDMTRP